MQVINDTEIFEPSECYFCVETDSDSGDTNLYITNKSFWDEERCLNDCFADHSFSDATNDLIEKFAFNLMEATWGSELSVEETRQKMLELGFVENADMI